MYCGDNVDDSADHDVDTNIVAAAGVHLICLLWAPPPRTTRKRSSPPLIYLLLKTR
jgi:hypothetical protein